MIEVIILEHLEMQEIKDEQKTVTVMILPVTVDDLDEIYKIELECFGGDAYPRFIFNYLLSNPNSIFLKALKEDQVAGFIAGVCRTDTCTIYTLNVKKDFRRKGVGSILLEAFEKEALKRNVRKIVLQVEVTNTAALNLYLKKGYQISRLLKDYYGWRRDAYEAFKIL
ncbi:MAG: ribosomal protein S18-alanine N-acetyltransferase [Thaumarchaeota archaeon]|jgi:ribosomal-protein-alanine N-acetyltransferase|nr:ribosomal protein S18-alanine N-acetyltransferase [Candidatus Geocrenenecus arthurdayi]MCL7389508.1 ribosomal protein S18-alanine N-acetyltransferase [Candidatus Geocrenenecus arthurdayi]MCL7391143.1 ribosomal protein S18-alanine N-acetyltransferase [Candidatus Geocrenenecus arthurdayi]MCL7397069.1 ribosomal protein S18-alanine N-acetyltransferase [Candidatus Geocrenenecus arthurdayi]MCL7402272.1 ribosomal protein S18-alanine N-acetyltransferase [Candidatus Geocrenenecus arthurdayi]